MNPELAFCASCCRWPDDDLRRERIGHAARLVEDWPRVLALAKAHRIEGLVSSGVKSAAVEAPADVAHALAAAAEDIRARAFLGIVEILRVTEALAAESIEVIVLKGLPLGMLAYGTPTIKRTLDIDLLVKPADAVRTGRVLERLGYPVWRPGRPFTDAEFGRWSYVSKEAQFTGKRGMIDLHWDLVDQPLLLPGLDPWSEQRQVALLDGREVSTLADSANLAFLAAHGGIHAWSRLKWLADFSAFLAARGAEERERLCDSARRFVPGHALDLALTLIARLFGPGLAPEPRAGAGEGSAARRLAQLSLQVIEGRTPGVVIEQQRALFKKIQRIQWSIKPGIGYRIGEARRRFRDQEIRFRVRWPLPRGLHWAYLPMRIPGAIAGKLWRASRAPDRE